MAESLRVHEHHSSCLGCGADNPGTLGLVALDHFLQGGQDLPERVRRHWEGSNRELPY